MAKVFEVCPHCEIEHAFPDWDVKEQGYVAKCPGCGREIFLCSECMDADDNPAGKCDWHLFHVSEKLSEGRCFRGTAHYEEKKRSNMTKAEIDSLAEKYEGLVKLLRESVNENDDVDKHIILRATLGIIAREAKSDGDQVENDLMEVAIANGAIPEDVED